MRQTNIGRDHGGETTRYLNDKYGDIAGQAYGVGISSAKSLESMAIGVVQMSKALGLTGKSADLAVKLATGFTVCFKFCPARGIKRGTGQRNGKTACC